MSRFLPLFLEKYNKNDKQFLNVNPMSVKMVLKMMYQFFNDKAYGAKDSMYTKQSSLAEFMYDQLFVRILNFHNYLVYRISTELLTLQRRN